MSILVLLSLIACSSDKAPSSPDSGDDTNASITDADGDGYDQSEDCDEDDPNVNPGAAETPYNGVDDDCDDTTADDDLDGDGFGQDEDCDDYDATVNPDAQETWYDGVDQDCGGDDDYDKDGDGDQPIEHGGTDCDDEDPERYGGCECRPETTAVFAGIETLNADLGISFSDLVYDSDGVLYLCTLISGTDYVYVYEDTDHTSTLVGHSNWNMNAIALDTYNAGEVIVGYITGVSLGYESDGSLDVLISGSGAGGGSYSNSFMRGSPNSLAVDGSGCIWTTNLTGEGKLSCVLSDGTTTDYTVGNTYMDAVAVDSSDTVHVTQGTDIISFNPADGSTTTVVSTDNAVLDFVFDYNDDIYLHTDTEEIWHFNASEETISLFGTVTGQGRLAIHPAGSLVFMRTNPEEAAVFEEFSLN